MVLVQRSINPVRPESSRHEVQNIPILVSKPKWIRKKRSFTKKICSWGYSEDLRLTTFEHPNTNTKSLRPCCPHTPRSSAKIEFPFGRTSSVGSDVSPLHECLWPGFSQESMAYTRESVYTGLEGRKGSGKRKDEKKRKKKKFWILT